MLEAFSDPLILPVSLSKVRAALLRVSEHSSTLLLMAWVSSNYDTPMSSTITDYAGVSRQ